MKVEKDIAYLGKDFTQFRKNLIEFTRQYFPNDYTDFNESSPGSLFMEMAAYVGDVLSYYADTNLRESLIVFEISSNEQDCRRPTDFIIASFKFCLRQKSRD